MEAVKKTERIFYFDIIRALAIILIILVHTSKWFIKYQPVGSIAWQFVVDLGLIGNVGVQLFLMISGALLLNRTYNLKDFYKKRFLRVLIPCIFWTIILVIFRVTYLGNPLEIHSIINFVFFDSFLWFVWVLLGLYLFLPVINSFIKEYGTKGAELFLIIWTVTLILNFLGHYPIENIELRYFSGFLGFMVLGWYLSNKEFKINDKIMLIIGILMFILSSMLAFYFQLHEISFGLEYKLSIIIALQAIGLYLSILYFAKIGESNTQSSIKRVYSYIKRSKLNNIITSISICSYGMYLTHYFFIWTVRATNPMSNIFSKNPFVYEPILFISTILFSWALIWIISKIPYLKKISGT